VDRFLDLALPARVAGGPARVGAVANLRPVKGLDGLLRAVGRLAEAHPGLTLHVAGEGPERARLEGLAASLGLAGRVHLPGAVRDVPGFLAGLGGGGLPSRAEGRSNALLGYLAAGRPIVATAVGSAAEVLGEGACGLLVPPDDEGSLADAIRRLVADPSLARRLGERARRRAGGRYSRA